MDHFHQHFFESAFDVSVGPWSEVPLTVMMHIRIFRSALESSHACTHMYKKVLNQNIQLRLKLIFDVFVFPENICCFFGIDQWTTVFGYLTRSI